MKNRKLSILLLLIMLAGCAGAPAPMQTDSAESPAASPSPVAADNATTPLQAAAGAPDNGTRIPAREARQDAPPAAKPQPPQAQPKPEPRPPADNTTGGKIALNFDDADIYEVINALSDFLGINYIIDPSIKGKVNIHTSGEIDRSQLLPILETIFDMNNIALVKFGDIYKIMPIKESKQEILDIYIGRQPVDSPSYDRVIIQIVPLQYVSSSDIEKVLKPFVSKGGDIVDYKKGNLLIIVESSATVSKILKLINIIDTDVFQQTGVRFFKIRNAEIADVAKELEDVFTSLGFDKSTEKGIGIKFIPIERVSCVLAISSVPGIFEQVEHWIGILDAVDLEAEEQVFIYFVENGKAEEIADVLKKIYGEGATEKKASPTTTARRRTQKTAPAETKTAAALEGKIKIVTDETTNSIIVLAIPQDYAVIRETIRKLDIIPKQVLIEVLIAEVTLSGDTEFGIEWALKSDSARIGGYKGEDTVGLNFGMAREGGFTYMFDSDRLQVFLRAQASKNKLNILSSPHILAADNKEARIEVGQEVPIVTSEYVPQDVEVNTSTSRSIEYRSTGVILTVTPRVNDKGLVAMEITQEVSEAQPVVAGGIQSPVISNRKAETSLVVQNSQTIVIGGLIKEQASNTVSGVPFLSHIPLISYLFSNTKDKNEKTELLILITPHVINTIDEAAAVSREFSEKLNQIKKLIKKSGDYWGAYNTR